MWASSLLGRRGKNPKTLNPKPSGSSNKNPKFPKLSRGRWAAKDHGAEQGHEGLPKRPGFGLSLPLVSREWRNEVQLQLLLLPFFHSLLTKGRLGFGAFRLSEAFEVSEILEVFRLFGATV